MSGFALFNLWMLLLLGCSSEVARAKVANAKVTKGNFRRADLYRSVESINVTQLGGVIFSPRFPKPYPRNLMLSWKLLSPPGSRIHLEFKNFSLEGPVKGACSNDFVEVEGLNKAASIVWGRWCGRDLPHSINSTGNILRIAFKSNDLIVAKGFKIQYSLLYDPPVSNFGDPMLMSDFGDMFAPVTEVPFSLEDLDRAIAPFDTIEELLQSLHPDTWRQDLDSIYTAEAQILYRSRAYHLASRENKVDLNRLYDDVKRYSCTPRNFSVNIREELRITSAVYFPRCLLVKRCGGNCGCGTDNWNTGCTCQPAK
uniref:Platelet derived growth factor d n=1 Tax=Neogobius melanostomus TaxID=47308 RepID=A0A8C6TXZ2_9GOBI